MKKWDGSPPTTCGDDGMKGDGDGAGKPLKKSVKSEGVARTPALDEGRHFHLQPLLFCFVDDQF